MLNIFEINKSIELILDNLTLQNYHKHTSYSNIYTPDSGANNEEYAKRAKELGSSVLCSGEHGYQGNYWDVYDIAKANGLKFVFSCEAYWVKDRFEKDRTNSHIVLIAKNENGRRKINGALSEANDTGYYYKPRLDLELLLSLPPDDVFVTSACIAFWAYDDIEESILKLHNHFGDNFMLEVQYHDVQKQADINRDILRLSKEHGIDIICGLDSHYILPEHAKDRDYILEYKHIQYEEENGFYLDYPDVHETYKRFKTQGVLSDEEILRAINNTNLILDFEDIVLDDSIKLPNLFPDKTQEERNEIYKGLLQKGWNKTKKDIPKEKHELYRKEIRKEANVVLNTKMADYFIDDYYLVKKAVEMGGKLTLTGRGSGVSFYTNKLLGFTDVDRIAAPVKMYPERFMSEARILQTKSLPDLDLNWGNPEVAEEAQTIVFGEGHSYPMIAYGTLKAKSAFKWYAGANHIPFDIANNISKQIDEYEKDLKYADEQDREDINIYHYVAEEYHYLLDDSKKYRGVIESKKRHPCGYLLYDGNIREEIGLIKVKTESTKKEYMVACIDGKMADKYGFVKNDLLKVDVVNNIKDVYNNIGIEYPSILELGEILKTSPEMQRVYHEGITIGINQFEKESTTLKSTKYKILNVSEATAFVAAIRPSFKSMYDTFEKRQEFEYGIKVFDELIATEEMPDSFILYQEQLMTALGYSGIPMDETMTLIKAISKKKEKVIMGYKTRFLEGFSSKIMEDGSYTLELAEDSAHKVWQIIEDSAQYGFNASHAYCVANDSLYGAHLKSHYPYEFYEYMLETYSMKGKKDKVALLKKEMTKFYNIVEGDFKLGADNRKFTADKENNCIHPSVLAIKGFGKNIGYELYDLGKKDYDNFIDVLIAIGDTIINSSQTEILIKLEYFSKFGGTKRLLKIKEIYDNIYERKQISKSKMFDIPMDVLSRNCEKETDKTYLKIDYMAILNEMVGKLSTVDYNIIEKLGFENEYLGYVKTVLSKYSGQYNFITSIEPKGNNQIVELYNISNGDTEKYKIKGYNFIKNPLTVNQIIGIIEITEDGRWKTSDEFITDKNPNGFYQDFEDKELILTKWKIVKG